MKKIVSILFLMIVGIFLYACTEFALPTPSATLMGDTISWDAVEGAAQYYVYIDDTATTDPETDYYTVAGTSFDLTTVGLTDGTYSVYVVAVAGTSFSANSTAATYVVGDGDDVTLNAPTNVTLTNDMLSWDAVTDATGYTIFIGTSEVDVTTTSYDLSQESLADGTYTVYVVATAGTVTSANSASTSYVVSTQTNTLSAPTNVTVTDNVISWDAVTGADSYVIHIDEYSIPVSGTSYDLTQVSLTIGDYSVTVVAVDTAGQSPSSTAITYARAVNANAIIAGILPLIDDSYTVGLVESDFDESWQFENYENTLTMITAYAEASQDSGLLEDDAINFFQSIIDMTEAEDNFESISAFLASTDMFEPNNMTADTAAHLLMSVMSEVMAMQTSGMTMTITELQADVAMWQSDLTTLLADTGYLALLDIIANNAPLETLPTATAIAAGGELSAKLVMKFVVIASDRQNDIFNFNDYYYEYDLDDAYVDDIVDIVIAIETSDDASFLETIQLMNYQVYNILSIYQNIRYKFADIDRVTLLMDRLDELTILMNDDMATMEAAVATVFDFIITLHDTFPPSVITLLDDAMSGESVLTTTEIILIKDDLIAFVSDALPSETEFQDFYQALLMVGEVALGNPINDLETHADYLGSVGYNTAHIGLLFLGSVSLTDVAEVTTIIQALQTAYGESGTSPLENLTPLLDAIGFIQTYIETFKTDHATEVAELEALLNADAFEPLYQEILIQLAAIATEENPEELDMILYILDELSTEYDNIMNVMAISPDIADGLFQAFMDSNGSILSVIAGLNMEDPTVADIVSALETVIDEAALYHDILADQFTQENIESILSIALIPALVEAGVYMEETDATETAIRALIPDVAQVIMNAATLEQDVFTSINELVISDYINETNGFSEPVDVGSAFAFIHILDSVFTPENETLIDDTITLIFTDILSDSTLQSLLPVDPLELSGIQSNLETMIDDIITNIHTYAALDITTLSEADELMVMQFAASFGLFINTEPSEEEQINQAQVLTLDTPFDTLYATDPVFYSFTPATSGYYSFEVLFEEAYEGNYEFFDESRMYFEGEYFEDSQINGMRWLDAGETYYISIRLYNEFYVNFDMTITTYVAEPLTLDVPVDVNSPEGQMIYEFTPATDGYYSFMISTASEINYGFRMIDSDGNLMQDRGIYLYDDAKYFHFYAVSGMPTYIEIIADPYSYMPANPFTILVETYDATSLEVDVPLLVNYSADVQNFAFMVPNGGPYELSFTATAETTVRIWFGADEYYFTDSIFNPSDVNTEMITQLLQTNELYRIEVSNMVEGDSFTMTLTARPMETLNESTPIVWDAGLLDRDYFQIEVTDDSIYDITYSGNEDAFLEQTISRENGEFMKFSSGVYESDYPYTISVFLPAGLYIVEVFTQTDNELTVSLAPLETFEVMIDEEIMVDVLANQDFLVSFTPEFSGEYSIYSYDLDFGNDPYVTVYDIDGTEIGYDDDMGEDLHFELNIYLQAGETYLISFSNYDDAMYYASISLDEMYDR